ncbi:hypothetical protein GE061_005660 [Apolygus lucorum]|uniref:Transmembrane protein n=1 Tax=Apolygus lucorum TaxID=248454 RepID=A0A8S9WX06_APOLU|nr:hypothetical protein GE061_005660 [Apolygus lucorum]
MMQKCTQLEKIQKKKIKEEKLKKKFYLILNVSYCKTDRTNVAVILECSASKTSNLWSFEVRVFLCQQVMIQLWIFLNMWILVWVNLINGGNTYAMNPMRFSTTTTMFVDRVVPNSFL